MNDAGATEHENGAAEAAIIASRAQQILAEEEAENARLHTLVIDAQAKAVDAQARARASDERLSLLRRVITGDTSSHLAHGRAREVGAGPKRRGRNSPDRDKRRVAIIAALFELGPTGPTELAEIVSGFNGTPTTDRVQATDILRRDDETFERCGNGTWKLTSKAEAAAGERAQREREGRAMPA